MTLILFLIQTFLAICQTDIEEKESRARIYIANYRHGKQHGSVGIYRDLSIGQFAVDEFEVKDDWGETSGEEQAGIEW